jgi:hypothetical protein
VNRLASASLTAGIVTATLVGGVLVGGPAQAAPARDYFIVNTGISETPGGSSPIIESGGAFAGCTTVTDLSGGAEQITPRKVLFFGDKQVNCPGGTVTIHFVADINFQAGRKTSGYWFVVESTLPGVSEGGGTVRGDNTQCEPQPCIQDVFRGTVG